MSDDNPFAEPDDTDKTVIRPNPGGRRTPATPAAPPAEPMAAPPAAAADTMGIPAAASAPQAAKRDGPQEVEMVLTGMNQLTACAAPLFSLISRIRNRAQHMDPDKLRSSVVAEVRAFENRALQAGIPAQTVKIARYALCATLDDVVLNTPWGGQSSWGLQSMVGTFHRETVGGDRFYDLLARLEKEPANNLDVLEFIYMCLSLGFEGRLRIEQGGPDKHLQIRQGLARIIRGQRGDVERDLSPHWEGEDKPYRALSAWRLVWIALGTTAALLALQFTGLSYLLSNQTERLIGQLSVIDSGPVAALQRRAPPPPPTPPDEVRLQKVVTFLQKEIDEGIVNVFQKGNTLVIRIAGSNMFGSGSDKLTDSFAEPIARVANALNDEPGPVIITGHSDNIPIKSSRFPSNMHLSLARAKSVMASMANTIKDPSRLTAEGRAEKEPIADNSTREGRAENRRIEVLLVQEAS
ncbi:OmpA family protein [Sulfitobacter noctilucicola]|uniref:Type VI secretion system protein ImpK n=1 Tax=Sulfitobacter noctilucicola TaxID=1342301 RepID=A0A7W6MCF2_9RHOB|nr:type IVB secretion system protein IcmH/DotU [Sulfitobacter noctilucicola]KIN69986.1 OmpA family protein [Sulfitobacter noctilucicola]MBB4175998.1 type VI secretion system protein ImpK [Sulfitobacter noctilucicola]